MVHTFKIDGTYMVLDVNSASVHVIDELAYDVINLYEQSDKETIHSLLGHKYDTQDIQDVLDAIEELKSQNLLFTQWTEHDMKGVNLHTIKAMCLHIAHDCDLRCRYCFAGTGSFHGSREMMSAEVGKKALDFLVAKSGNTHQLEVDFFGGEPLMNFDVVKELTEYGQKLNKEHNKLIRFTMTTNCTALDEKTMQWLNDNMNNVVLSIDGRKEVHDNMRPDMYNNPTYDNILPKAQRMAELRGDKAHYARGTFTSYNLDFANDVMDMADKGFTQISIEPVVTQPSKPYALREEHLEAIKAEYERLMKLYIDRRKNGKWFSFFHFNIDLDNGPCAPKRLSGCGAGASYVAVTPNGDIYPCHQFAGEKEWLMGHVDSLELDQTIQELFKKNNVANKEKCSSCWAKFFCGGGCAANAWHFNKDISKPYDIECELERKRVECALNIYSVEHS